MTWLYTPYTCAPVTEDSSSHFDPGTYEPYVTLSGTPTRRPLSWHGWKRRPWIKRLSGTISQPSTADRGVAAWISSLEGSHAPTSRTPANEPAPPDNIGYGRTSPESSVKHHHEWCSSKTCLASSQGWASEAVAYVAGLVDGEGSVTIQRNEHRGTPQIGCVAERVQASVRREYNGESAGAERGRAFGDSGMESAWGAGGVRVGCHAAGVAQQTGAGGSGCGVVPEGSGATNSEEWETGLDSGTFRRLAQSVRADAAIEQARGSAYAGRGYCGTCGRSLDGAGGGESVRVSALGDVLWSLAALGFDAEWGCLSAAAVGAPHKRERVWIMAHRNSDGWGTPRRNSSWDPNVVSSRGAVVANRVRSGRERETGTERGLSVSDVSSRRVAHAVPVPSGAGYSRPGVSGGAMEHEWPPLPRDAEAWAEWVAAGNAEPVIRGGIDGSTGRMVGGVEIGERLHLLGNGLVPQCATEAIRQLLGRAGWVLNETEKGEQHDCSS
jgi:hypothetical protein